MNDQLSTLFFSISLRIVKLNQLIYRNKRSVYLTDENLKNIEETLNALRKKRDDLKQFIKTSEFKRFLKSSKTMLDTITKSSFQETISQFILDNSTDVSFVEQLAAGKGVSIATTFVKKEKHTAEDRSKYKKVLVTNNAKELLGRPNEHISKISDEEYDEIFKG